MEKKLDMLMNMSTNDLDAKELRDVLDGKTDLVACDGFEPAGRMELGQVYYRTLSYDYKCDPHTSHKRRLSRNNF